MGANERSGPMPAKMKEMTSLPEPHAPAPEAPLCLPLREERQEEGLRLAPLPAGEDRAGLLAAFRAAPQFSRVGELPRRDGKGRLRVLLLGRDRYYCRQAAVYLSALTRQEETREDEDFWSDVVDALPEQALASSSISVREVEQWLHPQGPMMPGAVQVIQAGEGEEVSGATDFALLLEGPLSHQLADRLETADSQEVFLSVPPEQALPGVIDRLRFEQGFAVCPVGEADLAYWVRLLRHTAREMDILLSPRADLAEVVGELRRFRGDRFRETDFALLLEQAARRWPGKPLEGEMLRFRPFRDGQPSGLKQLDELVGLAEVKACLKRFLALARLEQERLRAGLPAGEMCRSLAFAGPPGTCKSVTARLVARILREQGVGSGAFVEAGREQLIGQFLGHTSPKIARLFEKAKGGVLFIDEAGALVSSRRDEYAAEAVNALVRHMELHPETMVIFATYPEEMDALLGSNPGLSSRVRQVLSFPAYTEEELCAILAYLARQGGYRLPEGAERIAAPCFATLKRRQGDRFGNGREARRLFQEAVGELAMRQASGQGGDLQQLTEGDLEQAAGRLLAGARQEERRIGF